MKIRAVILAGGEGERLGVLTAKRTKPAVPFAGKYRIIDFTLSNCVNSKIFDVMILAQYRPHSLIEHIGAGSPWDLNRDFTGGVHILTPYKARRLSDWYLGTADAVQQNFLFIKRDAPNLVLILSGDHIYKMNYANMIEYHQKNQADVTIATIHVPVNEAKQFGILEVGEQNQIMSFMEKPPQPPSNLANMGVYLFNLDTLDHALWEDSQKGDSRHDFGHDLIPGLIAAGKRVFAYPFDGYWVDVGTVNSYWKAHMDLLKEPPPFDLNDRSWIVHTRTEERPPVRIARGAKIYDSMISEGCSIAAGARIEHSVLAPGVRVDSGAQVRESILLTDVVIESDAIVECAIVDKRVCICKKARVGNILPGKEPSIAMIGKNCRLPAGMTVEPGAMLGPDVVASDLPSRAIQSGEYIQTKRLPYEI